VRDGLSLADPWWNSRKTNGNDVLGINELWSNSTRREPVICDDGMGEFVKPARLCCADWTKLTSLAVNAVALGEEMLSLIRLLVSKDCRIVSVQGV
jgi:hypothetical protein